MTKIIEDYNKSLPENGSTMQDLYNQMLIQYNKNVISNKYALIEIPDHDGYLSCICEMLSNALTSHLLGNIDKAIYRKAYLKERFFVGREEELSEISQRLDNHEIVVLSGEPGIGKSELAFRYAYLNKDKYSMINYVSYSDNIKETLCKIQRVSPYDKFQFTEHDILRILSAYSDSALLIIEDADEKALTPDVVSWLNKSEIDIIVTSRYRYDDAIDLKKMEVQELLEIMCHQTTSEQKRIEFHDARNLAGIIKHSSGNTALSVLFATVLANSSHKVDAILREEPRILFESEVGFAKNNSEKQIKEIKTVSQHISSLFDNYLSMEALHILYFFALIDIPQLPIINMKNLCPICTDEMIEYLERYHILSSKGENGNEVCQFEYIAFQVFQSKALLAQESYENEINAIKLFLINFNRDEDYIHPSLLRKLVYNLKSESDEWTKCKYEILSFLESNFPDSNECASIKEILAASQNKDSHCSDQISPLDINQYYNLITDLNRSEEYRQYVNNHLIQKINDDAALIKQLLKDTENGVLSGTYIHCAQPTDMIIKIIKSYLYPEMLNLTIPEQSGFDICLMIKDLLSELNSSEIGDTRMYSSIKRLLSDDQINCIPDIFSNIKSYKLTLFYTLCFICIDLFYLDKNDDNNQKDKIANAFNEFLHNHLILSDENRIVLLTQLAKMQIASGNLQEAKNTMQETESFSNIIQSPNFLYKYVVSKVDIATRLFIQTSIDDLKQKIEHPSLDDLDALCIDSLAYFKRLMEEIHRDYASLMIELKEIDGYLFTIFVRNFKELTDNAKYKLKLIKEEDLSFVLSPGYGKPTQIDAQKIEEAINQLNEIKSTLKAETMYPTSE